MLRVDVKHATKVSGRRVFRPTPLRGDRRLRRRTPRSYVGRKPAGRLPWLHALHRHALFRTISSISRFLESLRMQANVAVDSNDSSATAVLHATSHRITAANSQYCWPRAPHRRGQVIELLAVLSCRHRKHLHDGASGSAKLAIIRHALSRLTYCAVALQDNMM